MPLDSLAKALALTEVERKHLVDLSGAKRRTTKTIRSRPDQVRPGTKRLVDAMDNVPTVVLGKRTEVLAWNQTGHRLVASHLDFDASDTPAERPNMTWMRPQAPCTRSGAPRPVVQWRPCGCSPDGSPTTQSLQPLSVN